MTKARQLADLGNAYDDGALSHRNLIINGACNVDQRNTVGTANGAFGPDRFIQIYGGGLTSSIEQGSVASGTDPYAKGFRNTVKLTNTSTSTNTGRYVQLEYRMEGQDLNRSGWDFKSSDSSITLSFWVKVSVAGTYSLFMEDKSLSNRLSLSFTVGANTWTKVIKNISGSSILGFADDASYRSRIVFVPSYGSDYTTSGHVDGVWAAMDGSSYVPDESHAWATTASATFEITGVQLEVGDTATPFEHRSYGDELARCQRYYERVETSHRNSSSGYYTNYGNGKWVGPQFQFKVTKRASPTMSDLGTFSWRRANFRNASATTIGTGATGFSATTTDSSTVDITESGPSNGNTALVYANAGYTIEADAEL